MTGLGGEDRFLLSRYDGFDRIKDFTLGTGDLVCKGLSAGAITAKAAIYPGISGTDVSYGSTDHVLLEKVALANFDIGIDVVFARLPHRRVHYLVTIPATRKRCELADIARRLTSTSSSADIGPRP
jgi:hypothetical protein